MSDDPQDKKPRRGVKGGTPGPGRPKGSKDSIPREVKQNIAEFFTNLTAGNLRWRQCVDRILSGVATAADLKYAREFRAWSDIALNRSLGTPAKAVIEKPSRDPVHFVTQHGYLPFDTRVDPGRQKSIEMIAAKAADEELRALEAKKAEAGEVIDAPKATTGDPDAEGLESVYIPPLPDTFDPPVRERDRAPGGRS